MSVKKGDVVKIPWGTHVRSHLGLLDVPVYHLGKVEEVRAHSEEVAIVRVDHLGYEVAVEIPCAQIRDGVYVGRSDVR